MQLDGDGDDTIYLLEVNPRASRTVPFVSKATGMPLAKIAARCMAGKSLAEQGAIEEIVPDYYSVKEAIFPFAKFQGVDPILGPEMRSTGEVMGVGRNFGAAFARAQEAASIKAPPVGKAFVSVRDPGQVARAAGRARPGASAATRWSRPAAPRLAARSTASPANRSTR